MGAGLLRRVGDLFGIPFVLVLIKSLVGAVVWYARWVRDGCPLVARAANVPAVVINNHSVGVHVQPPGVFDVETNVRLWLKQLNLYLQRNEILDERVKIDVLVSRLSDRVGNLLEKRVQALGSYDEITNLLIRTFDKEPRSPMHYFRLMGARVQRIDEGVQYYYADLAALAKMVNTTSCRWA